jgi:transcriptional regulator with XRE-family HTH domain
MSQYDLAKAMGTSQSAIARIESAQENPTLTTVERMVGALDGRFYVSIRPSEFRCWHEQPWWESPGSWNLKAIASRQTSGTHGVLMWFEKSDTLSAGILLPEGQAR